MRIAAFLARIGEKLLDLLFGLFLLLVILYGGYSIYDVYQIKHQAFVSEEMLKYKPDIENEEAPTLQELQKIAPDVFAWISVPGTHIDYPVVTCRDNLEYVNMDIYGNFSFSGAVFLDCTNHADMSDSYSIFYGHHMDNGAMFGDIAAFASKDYFDAHKTGVLQTIGKVYYIEFFAFCSIDAYHKLSHEPLVFQKENMSELSESISDCALYARETAISEDDHIISLYTCYDAVTNGRYLLFGKLTEKS